MAVRLNMKDTAVVLWALRHMRDAGVDQGVEGDDPLLKDLQRLIKTYDRSFKALVRVGQ